MSKGNRLFGSPQTETLEEQYFKHIRPQLYEQHGSHAQYGSRAGRSLAEHLDSACQFVLTVSKIAEVPEEKRGCVLAATTVHDLNKLANDGRNVKTLARDRAFLKEQLKISGVDQLVKTDEDLELVRKLIERHSGHNVSDGTRFLPEDPNIKKWAAMLIGADLFDLGIDKNQRIRKVENELTVALGRHCQLFEITLSEDRGYLTSLLLGACEEVLHNHNLSTLAINPDGLILLGNKFPEEDLTLKIATQWQKKINKVFGSNIEQLITDKSTNGIKVDNQAIQQDIEATLEQVDALLAKKYSNYKANTVAQSIEKYRNKVSEEALIKAESLELFAISNAEEFSISEGLKAAYVSYRQIKPQLSVNEIWQKINQHIGLSDEQSNALEAFDAQYGRCLFAVKASTKGMDGVQVALRESFEMRKGLREEQEIDIDISPEIVNAVKYFLNLPIVSKSYNYFEELLAYINARPDQRSSLGATAKTVGKLKKPQMPPETKVQIFSNRLGGGSSGDPVRSGDFVSQLSYQLLAVGANFPKSSKQEPLYLHFALPQGSSPELKAIWRKWLQETAANNAEGGTVTVDELQLYRDNIIAFKGNKVVGAALPKRADFVESTVIIPVVWGDVNNSLALLKSLRLALELALAIDFGFPFILGGNLEVKTDWNLFGRVEGIPSALQALLGNGQYYRNSQLSEQQRKHSLTAEDVLERLRCIGKLSIIVANLTKKDDCLYDLARGIQSPFSLYYILLRWALREKDESSLDFIFDEIHPHLSILMEKIMSEKDKAVAQSLRKAAQIACEGRLWGNIRRRTGRAEPFTAFLKAIRSFKHPLDWDTVFAALTNQYHTRLDRIRDGGVGNTKYEYIESYYKVLYELFDKEYQLRPERLLNHAKDLEAGYLHFLREAYKNLKLDENNKEN